MDGYVGLGKYPLNVKEAVRRSEMAKDLAEAWKTIQECRENMIRRGIIKE